MTRIASVSKDDEVEPYQMQSNEDGRRPHYEYNLAGNLLLHELMCEKDFGVDIVLNLSLEHHIRRIFKVANYVCKYNNYT